MGYKVLYGNQLLFDPYTDDRITDTKLSSKLNAASYFDFTIAPTHSLYSKLAERAGEVRIHFNNLILFKGEITKIDEDFEGNYSVSCTGVLDYLTATRVRPYSTVEGEQPLKAPSSYDGYFQWLIDQHNSNCLDSRKHFSVGVNQGNMLDKNNYIYRSSEQRPTTASEIEDKILNSAGGYLFVRYQDDLNILDLYADIHDANTQIIDYGVNMLDFTKTTTTEGQYTAVVATGYTPDPPSGQTNTKMKPITLDGCTDGGTPYSSTIVKMGDRVYDINAVNRYGYHEYYVSNTDIKTYDGLLYYACKTLSTLLSPALTISVKAVDLALIMGDKYQHLQLGQAVRIRSKPRKIDEYLMVNSIDLDLMNPENTTFDLGASYDTLTGQQSAYLKSLNASINTSLDTVSALGDNVKNSAKLAQEAKDTANTANTNATYAVNKADSVTDLANSAVDKAEAASTKANEATSKVNLVEKQATEAKSVADSAKQAADEANTAADNANQAATEANVTAGNAQSTADTAKANAAAAQTKANEAADAASNAQSTAETAKANAKKAQDDTDALKNRVNTAETSIKQNSDQIALKATKTEVMSAINDINIGGRNYVLGSEKLSNFNIENASSVTWVDQVYTRIDGGDNAMHGIYYDCTIPITDGSSTCLSVYLTDVSRMIWIGLCDTNQYDYPLDDAVIEVSADGLVVFKTSWNTSFENNKVRIYIASSLVGATCKLSKIKFEFGNKATDWSPAPEDYSTTTEMQSEIDQTSDSIKSTVAATYVNNETLSSYATQSQLEQTSTSLTASIQTTNTTVSGLETTVNKVNDYMTFGSESGQPTLTIGSSSSSFRTKLTNTSEKFMQGSQTVMELDGVSSTVKASRVQMGHYQWRDAGDSMQLVYVP